MASRPIKRGRKRGGRNRGYFFRKGRGWCTSEGTRAVPLRFEDGEPIRDQSTPVELLREALKRHQQSNETPAVTSDVTVLEVCRAYLEQCKATNSVATYTLRADTLFDFCEGYAACFRLGPKRAKEKKRIHKGYGELRVSDLKPLHIDQWLAVHKDWKGCRRTRIQAVKRALNYGVESKLIEKNPIKGYKTPKSGIRLTYLTPEQEAACYRFANPALALAIKVCIRTGARYGCEFIKLTARHVHMTPKGMEWRFSAEESKTGKPRVIRIPSTEKAAAEIIAIVQRQMELHPSGPLFRNTQGGPWVRDYMGGAFGRLRAKLAKKGIVLDDDSCMYSCRHTYAKRTLSGYWTGTPTTIERLSALMGNSREVCWEHYAGWCDAYTDPLWESA